MSTLKRTRLLLDKLELWEGVAEAKSCHTRSASSMSLSLRSHHFVMLCAFRRPSLNHGLSSVDFSHRICKKLCEDSRTVLACTKRQ